MSLDKLSSAHIAISDLLSNQSFVEIILNQSSNCILILDDKMELYAFNEPLKTLFYNKHEDEYLYQKCGEVIGCAFTIEEQSECGETSNCKKCELRTEALRSYYEKAPALNHHIVREFYTQRGKKEKKHLKFSTFPFRHNDNYFLVLIVEDMSLLMKQQSKMEDLENTIEELKRKLIAGISIPPKGIYKQ